MSSNIKQLIENPHPVYARYIQYWNFLLQSYEGGIDYCQGQLNYASRQSNYIEVKVNGKKLEDKIIGGNLFKHKKERDEDYLERVNMSYYYNFCSPIIDIYTNHLFKESVMSDWGNIETAIEARKDNIDHKGSNIDEFRHELAEQAQVFGHIYVLTDKPKTEMQIVSLAQQQELGLFPYLTIFQPQDLLNWASDEFGQLYWILLRECRTGNIDPMNFEKDKMNIFQYRIWTRTEWILFSADFVEIERGIHNLGKVPLDIIYNKPSKKYRSCLGISEIADISFIARDVYNKCSELNEIIRNQTFSILCLQGKATEYDEISVGTSKALLYPPERNQPAYISPAAENAMTLMTQIDKQVHKMFQLAKLEGGTAQQTSQVSSQSGVSKAFDFQETNSALAKKAGHMEDGEMRVWDTFARWEGQKEFDGSVSYSRDFNIQELNEELDEAEKMLRMQLGKEFNIHMKKELIRKKFPRIPDQELEKMMDEVETKEGQGEGSSLRDRLPGLFNRNATQGGKNGGIGNVKTQN